MAKSWCIAVQDAVRSIFVSRAYSRGCNCYRLAKLPRRALSILSAALCGKIVGNCHLKFKIDNSPAIGLLRPLVGFDPRKLMLQRAEHPWHRLL